MKICRKNAVGLKGKEMKDFYGFFFFVIKASHQNAVHSEANIDIVYSNSLTKNPLIPIMLK